MKAIPVIILATVIEDFHPGATEPRSRKRNTVAAKQAIDKSQKLNPTKSSGCSKFTSA